MKYGMNMLLWTTDVNDEHASVLESLKKIGYDGVELPIFEKNLQSFAAVGKRLDSLGLGRTAVSICSVETNPASLEAPIRAAAVQHLKEVIDVAHAAGATHLCGPIHSAIGHFSGAGPTADELKHSQDTLRTAGEYAEQAGITLVVEYLNRFECYLLTSAAQATAYVKAVNHPRVRTMYDTFHANIEEKCVAEAIRTISPVLAHVHISENDRSTPGHGQVDWKTSFKTLKEINYDGWMTVEAFGLALPAIAAATKIWRRMFKDELQLATEALKFMKDNWANA